ncbi:MAG TPA: peptidoglycan bridge formation glycyltransferase FemA/FemB family protein [Candidatus Limnocylindrales bacterium]|nr:peptidoglycan bridge formation glycyltransferase FemA/FemB family protein [Candidatus Limnocylindrales bacterium]
MTGPEREQDPWPADGQPRVEATPPPSWDEHTVDQPTGHVYQSLEWAGHRAASGWLPRYVVIPGGPGVLALLRPWPQLGGHSAYVPRGPIPVGTPAETAELAAQVAGLLEPEEVDVVAIDAEVPADPAYTAGLTAAGFHPIEEIQPSRHRMSVPLVGADEESAFESIAKSTRQRIRRAESDGGSVVRHDARLVGGVGEGFVAPPEPTQIALDRFYDLLLETGERRQFSFGPRESFVAWWAAAHRAGHLVHLEARGPDDDPLAGLILYRHGRRLSTVHSGDHEAARRDHPGALHLLRWRAIQLAIREGRDEMDLGGVDVAGARHEPREGDPMYGLYQHKRSFGAHWVELAGAHEKVIRPNHYRAGRIVARLSRILDRRPVADAADTAGEG